YVTVGGEKIGKSRGNAIEPEALVARYGSDALRYVLLRHVGASKDADIDEARILRVYESELADGLGNLVSRTLALARRVGPIEPAGERLADDLAARVDEAMARFAPDEALRAIGQVVADTNKYLADRAPWALLKDDPARARAILACSLDAIARLAKALVPFLPV